MLQSTLSITGIVFWLLFYCPVSSTAADLSATDIVNKSNEIEGGNDSMSRLTFTFVRPDGEERKLIYTMVWKEYAGRDDVDDKVIFFSEYPPDDKGKSFMVWVYEDKKNDEWMYLPELRMVRKVTHSERHAHNDKEDDFAHSVLTQVDLVPREADLDNNTLLKEEELDGHTDFVVESTPTDYYGSSGGLVKRQSTKWKKIGNAWVWERVVGEDLITKERTELDISDIKLNSDLKDDIFSARTLRLGKDSIAQ